MTAQKIHQYAAETIHKFINFAVIILKNLYELRIDLHAGGNQVRYLHKKAFLPGASCGEEVSIVTVEWATHYAYAAAVHVWRDLLHGVVSGRIRTFHHTDEAFHIAVRHHNRLVPGSAPTETVLERTRALDYRVERVPCLMHEEQVGNDCHLLGCALAILHAKHPSFRGEHLHILPLVQRLPCTFLGNRAFQVAQDIPFLPCGESVA